MTHITAHSGCEGSQRDSLDTLELAIGLGADVVEMDVRQAPDGTLRISHDPLSAADYEAQPKLETVFKRLQDTSLGLNCDIKEAAALYGVLDLAGRYGFTKERLILSGCTSPEQLARDRQITERAAVYLNIEEVLKVLYISENKPGWSTAYGELMARPWKFLRGMALPETWPGMLADLVKQLDVSAINLPHWCLFDPMVKTCREAEIPLSIWTVNDAETLERCLLIEPKNITTLEVKLALEMRNAFEHRDCDR